MVFSGFPLLSLCAWICVCACTYVFMHHIFMCMLHIHVCASILKYLSVFVYESVFDAYSKKVYTCGPVCVVCNALQP